ncbi:MAG: protein translocase subunit SecDF [Bacteroidetes bacterium]|nr:protein translocase subunit SecDF [Bacteroidota bacterium]
MQNKGAIKTFAILFAFVCLYHLSFTYKTYRVEKDAREYANNPEVLRIAKQMANGDVLKETFYIDSLSKAREKYYLDSLQNEVIYNLGIRKYTFKECKEREINLGLDLKGGMNVTLEVSMVDILKTMSGKSTDSTFNKAINLAVKKQKTSQKDFVTLFAESFNEVDPNAKMAAIFSYELKGKINVNSTNEEVIKAIRKETNDAFDRTYQILRQRIDKFGVAQPNIQALKQSERILVELPGVKDPERVRKLLQGTAQLEFWETFEFKEIAQNFVDADKLLASVQSLDNLNDTLQVKDSANIKAAKKDSLLAKNDKDSSKTLLDKLKKDTSKAGNKKEQTREQWVKEHPLFGVLQLNLDDKNVPRKGPVVGLANSKDFPKIERLLDAAKKIFPHNLKLIWAAKPIQPGTDVYQLYAIRVNSRDGSPALGGGVITDARQDFSQNGGNEISMSMNAEGAQTWKNVTGANIGKCIAIVLDNIVYSAPVVNQEITGGRSSITGGFSLEEAKDIANILKAGKLPAPAKIVEEAIVGPTLGKEAINAGFWSFIVAFALTLLFMIFYYNRAGMVANVALFANMFFVFGILSSLGAVLTLPGIAGIVLTIGMDVDKNVIIYERIREEIRAGKGIRLAIDDGYKHALTAIIDSNITTLLTGIVLFIFGSGPVQGFATTLIIGVLSSLFCAIFITKLIFVWMMDTNKEITVWNRFTKNVLTNVHFDFVGLRKTFYIVSLSLVVIGIVSLFTRGLSGGIDFKGGRSYVVRFDQDVKTDDIRIALTKVFITEPEVKTFGPNNQVKVTTSFMIDDQSPKTDSIVETKLYDGLKTFYTKSLTRDEFLVHTEHKLVGKLSSQKIEPTIAFDLLRKAYYAVFFSLLIIFGYVAFRFRKWQWGVGAVASLFHDSFIVIAIFSIFHGILPFSMDIGQDFIAAILTIIGYSIMDTVIIFDRIREYTNLYPKRSLHDNMNAAINSTLGRTLITSGITFMVLLAMFLFGGEVIRGFTFALLIGIAIGTYSSVFNATPIAYDLIMMKMRKQEKNKTLVK